MDELQAKRQKVGEDDPIPASQDFESFAPDGVVVFIVNETTRVRMHSIFMKLASPVFASMLGPKFREGQALVNTSTNANDSPIEIALPEEQDAVCFGWICRALHCQADTTI
ncbi:hypothetical protein F53441_8540 [Fusarium austroafricanum]|uniref:BTB domain-containing protein n=1 Tax=Fusarium austroafricanum TaxID=2364996 RepID=A0A8H4KD29_9HYPO|nr:hypothetical protein F53441_8540 [Fusarium austroafricanum]